MAYIQNDEEELQQGQGQPQVGQGSNLVDSSGGAGTSAGQGAGAGQGWTNIQAYLNANKGDTGSSQALTNAVGSQFGKERESFSGDSAKFLDDANKQVKGSIIGNDQADQYIQQAGDMYKYDNKNTTGGKTTLGAGEGSQQKVTPGQEYQAPTYDNGLSYGDITNKFQNFLGGQYQGPKEYNYNLSTDAQNYGSNLKDNAGFDTLMNDVYSKAAQKPLSSGQFQLQKQFDVNNENLVNARNNLSGQYDQLVADRDKTVGDTTSQLGQLENQYRGAQTGLKDYLGKQSNSYQTQIDKAEADARQSYNNEYKGGSGYGNSFSGIGFDPGREGDLSSGNANTLRDFLNSRGLGGDSFGHLTWEQLQKEQGIGNSGEGAYKFLKQPGQTDDVRDFRNQFASNTARLNDFYSAQDANYANTADPEERRYNAIQDFLGSNAARKQQGFKVRG